MKPLSLRHFVTAAGQKQTKPLPCGRLHTPRVLLRTTFQSPRGAADAVRPQKQCRPKESAGQSGKQAGHGRAGSRQLHQSKPQVQAQVRRDPGEPRGDARSGAPTVFCPADSRRCFPCPSPGFLPGKRASCRLVFWGHLQAYIGPIPRKWSSIGVRSATPQCSRTSSEETPESQPGLFRLKVHQVSANAAPVPRSLLRAAFCGWYRHLSTGFDLGPEMRPREQG